MIELIRTADPILLSWLETRLAEAGIESFVFDGHTSTVFGGTLDCVVRRMMVAEEDRGRASAILAEGQKLAG
jgi:hypothetical protein